MSVYYNDWEPYAVEWTQNLIAEGVLPDGVVDDRSIVDVTAADLQGFTQHHFFSGIGGWPHALDLAGWPRDRPVATVSCPCQPFSAAGLKKGEDDERHLWPSVRLLIQELRFPILFGEQVGGPLGREWLSRVRSDLESMGYVVGAADMPAACLGAPHIRQRLFFTAVLMGDTNSDGWSENVRSGEVGKVRGGAPAIDRSRNGPVGAKPDSGLANTEGIRRSLDYASDIGPTVRSVDTSRDPSTFDGDDTRRTSSNQRDDGSLRNETGVVTGRNDGARHQSGRAAGDATTTHPARDGNGGHRRFAGGGLGNADDSGLEGLRRHDERPDEQLPEPTGDIGGLADPDDIDRGAGTRGIDGAQTSNCGGSGGLADPERDGQERCTSEPRNVTQPFEGGTQKPRGRSRCGPWTDFEWIPCADAKYRRIEPGLEPLADGFPEGVGYVRPGEDRPSDDDWRDVRIGMAAGYGNAIVPVVAAAFIQATMATVDAMAEQTTEQTTTAK